MLPFSLISCVYSYAIVCTWLQMMWQEEGCIVVVVFNVREAEQAVAYVLHTADAERS